jgi:hypothetical protein
LPVVPEIDINDADFENHKSWLAHYLVPWSVVEEKWKLSSKIRIASFRHQSMLSLTSILTDWPAYASSNGARLVSIFHACFFFNKQK